jgi:hypothetical protein
MHSDPIASCARSLRIATVAVVAVTRGDYQAQSIAMTSPGIVYKDLKVPDALSGLRLQRAPFPTA